MMHRPTSEQTLDAPYAQYFANKTRRWELRLQGALWKEDVGLHKSAKGSGIPTNISIS